MTDRYRSVPLAADAVAGDDIEMSRIVTFRQADLQRAIKTVQAAGLPVTGVEIATDGTIRVLTSAVAPVAVLSAYDLWEAEQARKGGGKR